MQNEEYYRNLFVKLHDEQDVVERLKDIQESLMGNLHNAKRPIHFKPQLNIQNTSLEIEYLERKFIATPKIIKNNAGLWAYEYRFIVEQDGVEHDIWRFYLFQGGDISTGSNEPEATKISDITDDKVYRRIVGELLTHAQESALFNPTA